MKDSGSTFKIGRRRGEGETKKTSRRRSNVEGGRNLRVDWLLRQGDTEETRGRGSIRRREKGADETRKETTRKTTRPKGTRSEEASDQENAFLGREAKEERGAKRERRERKKRKTDGLLLFLRDTGEYLYEAAYSRRAQPQS